MTIPPDSNPLRKHPRPTALRCPRSCLLAFYLVILVFGMVLVLVRQGMAGIPRQFLGPGGGFSLLAGLVVAALTLVVCTVGLERIRWMRRLSRIIRRIFGPLSPVDTAWIGLLSGVGEEMLFRAGLQPILGLTITSVLFGSLHVLPPLRRNWPWTVFALILGLVLGWIYEVSGNLIGPIVAHAAINTVNLSRISRL